MSKATSNDVIRFELLPEGWRTMTLDGAREFLGNIIAPGNPRAGERSRVVDLTFLDKQSGMIIHKNFSLDRPTYLFGVIQAIYPDLSEAEQKNILDNIDWERAADVQQLFDKEVLARLYHEEYQGTTRNRIGNVVSVDTDVSQEAGAVAMSRSTVAQVSQPPRQPRLNSEPVGGMTSTAVATRDMDDAE